MGVKELRARLAEVMRAVREGQVVRITHRGRPVAEVRPLRAEETADGGDVRAVDDVFGMWTDRTDIEDASTWVHEGRRRRTGRSSSTRTS